jgi:DNA-binding NarL/FixJ family response regulator
VSEAKIRILVAEDHLIARVGLVTIINAEPDMMVAAEATNGQHAVEQFREHRPDVTLLDMRMPALSGVEAITAIRLDFPRAKTIAISTYGGDEDVRRALDAGAQAYLTKDVLYDELIKTIRIVYSGGSYLPENVSATLAAQWPGPDLSAREAEVLTLIVKGMPNKEIAAALHMSEHTAKKHVKNILSKLGVGDRTQAATTAVQRGIIHL